MKARKLYSISEFCDAHGDHLKEMFDESGKFNQVAKDRDSNLWRLHCKCGKTWCGDHDEAGIELG